MIFGKNAGLMLKYQKAKAKMVEYDVSKQEYPHFPLNSNELSYPTTYVLSRYSECIIENNHDELKELELLLITTAEYYDSAFKSKIDQNMIGIFCYLEHLPTSYERILVVLKCWQQE